MIRLRLRRGATRPGAPRGFPIVQTKGDANNVVDPWQLRLTQEKVWRVWGTVPVAGGVVTKARGLVGGFQGWAWIGLLGGLTLVAGGFMTGRRSRQA